MDAMGSSVKCHFEVEVNKTISWTIPRDSYFSLLDFQCFFWGGGPKNPGMVFFVPIFGGPPKKATWACFGSVRREKGRVFHGFFWGAKKWWVLKVFKGDLTWATKKNLLTFHYTGWLIGILDPYNGLL